MSAAIVCDVDGCGAWSLASSALSHGFVSVTDVNGTEHFCCGWHAAQRLAEWSEPVEVVR